MSTTTENTRGAVNTIRIALGIGGVVSAIVGILILVWPGHTAIVVTAIIAIYAIIAGLVYAAMGIFARSMRGWSRVGHIVLGVIFIIAGVIAFTRLAVAAASAPSTLIARPAIHHSGLSISWPGICAP